nr:hypothetical protein [Anaerolinea thermolimosa]
MACASVVSAVHPLRILARPAVFITPSTLPFAACAVSVFLERVLSLSMARERLWEGMWMKAG